ncbi:helix-turn-helix transcriptional regulator (plasmid) [Streptomyces sp. NBC_00184]|uniref:helix-turn-helix transcriptional regulator n=1 Tax=unclassified Streptomyces TaxID=2593676 RepID=UPI002E2A1952|nr:MULTISPECIES: helix-turn-helix transcriptional regulator [unclassified Streptomyces]
MSPVPGTPSQQPAGSAPSGPALRASLTELQDHLRGADAALARLLGQWGSGAGGSDDHIVRVLESREEQARRVYDIEYAARTTLWGFQSGANTVAPVPTTLPDGPDGPDDQRPDGNGPPMRKDGNPDASYRIVVDRDFLSEPAALRALDLRVERGHLVRVVDQPLIKLLIADGETAMVQVEPGRSLELRPPLVVLAIELFESVWRRSRPYLREDGDLSPTDRRILQLMLSGLTDAATAHQLGTSPRTVQRRVRALMDLAAVASRVQLGWYAMRNNWV